MHNFLNLFKGEMQRMIKYKILQISFVVTLLWLVIMFLIGADYVGDFVPLFIFMDASMMTVLLVGANLFFEKQENTLKTMLITPSSYYAILASKFIASVYLALQSAILISLFAYILFDVSVNFPLLVLFVVVITFAHTAIGFTFTVFVREFTGLLAFMIFYMFLFAFPSIFYFLGIFGDAFEYILMFSPTHGSLLMIDYAYGVEVSWYLLLIANTYLVMLGIGLIHFVVSPKYVETAVRE